MPEDSPSQKEGEFYFQKLCRTALAISDTDIIIRKSGTHNTHRGQDDERSSANSWDSGKDGISIVGQDIATNDSVNGQAKSKSVRNR